MDFCSSTLDICLSSSWNKTFVLINKIVLERKKKCLKYTLNLSQFLENSSKILGDIEVFLLRLFGCSFEFEGLNSAFDTKKIHSKKNVFF